MLGLNMKALKTFGIKINFSMGLLEIQKLKENSKLPKEKKRYTIPKKSAKRIAQEKELSVTDEKENWFLEQRKRMTGFCQCGCGEPSQKKDDLYFRHCICHIFPKKIFKSVMFHDLNWVERKFWGGCHGVMDDTSLDRWPGMEDWDKIKEKFFVLEPLLTDKEKVHKFFKHLQKLILEN